MKILRLIGSLDPRVGGPAETLRQSLAELQRLGARVEVLALDEAGAPWLADFPVPVYALGKPRLRYGYLPELLPWLKRHVAAYDAVVVHGLWQYLGFAARRACLAAGVPYFVFPHGMLDPWFKREYPLKHFKKSIYWFVAERQVLRDARAVVFTSVEERELARCSFSGYHAHEAVTRYGTASPPDAADDLRQQFFKANPHLQGQRIVLFLGRLHPKKGCDLLLHAFAQLVERDDRLHLLLVGPGEPGYVAGLQAYAQRLGIAGRVSWPGLLQGALKWGAFYAAEVFCLPSHQENFGVAVAEALACGKPVLISDQVNIWREIEADGAGFVDADSIQGTHNNLVKWLALNALEYESLCENAKVCFENRFHIRKAAEDFLEIIRS